MQNEVRFPNDRANPETTDLVLAVVHSASCRGQLSLCSELFKLCQRGAMHPRPREGKLARAAPYPVV